MGLPDRAAVVVVGGGIVGASVLYHLAHEGQTDALLLEKAEPTSGSTWHAAGQVTHSVGGYSLAAMRRYATELYASIEDESGVATSWHRCGSFRLAYRPIEVDWLRGQLGVAAYAGNAMDWVTAAEVSRHHPFYEVSEVLGAVRTPDDGHVDPSGATRALLAGARARGAMVHGRTRVLAITRRADGDFDVETDQGTVTCAHVVNAAGCYADRVAAMVGLRVPMANALHTYLVTDHVPEIESRDTELPVIRDDYVSGYVRQEQSAALIGVYEQSGAEAAWAEGPSWELEHPLFPADLDRIGPWLERAFERMPLLAEVGIRRVIRGAITHTPDGEPMLGPSGVAGFWMACGVQVGIADGPGLGRELARWMVHGETELSVRAYDARRFGFIPADDHDYGRLKGLEDYEYRHRTPVPGLERPAQRPIRRSTLGHRLLERGAVFTQVYGWERPKWFPGAAGLPVEDRVGFRRVEWFEPVGEECRAVRERVGLLELSAFTKLEVHGADAAAALDSLTTSRLPRVGRIGLTYLLTPTGRLEGEMTVTRLAEDRFYLVSAAVGEEKDLQHLRTHLPADGEVHVDVRSRELGVLVVAGPLSRQLLARCTRAALDNGAFPWLSARQIDVCGAAVRALRVGFTGELGWELHLDLQDMLTVYDGLVAAGADLGLADVGHHALNSLRMEKAYRTSRELTHDVDPVEAGVGAFVHRDKRDFVGRQALLCRDQRPRRWASAYLSIDADDADCVGGEAVYDGDRPVGLVSSGGYGYTTGAGHAFAWLSPGDAVPGTRLAVEIVGERRPARVLAEPAYDPKNERLRM
jgi:dimethylglycine dehydrogenase